MNLDPVAMSYIGAQVLAAKYAAVRNLLRTRVGYCLVLIAHRMEVYMTACPGEIHSRFSVILYMKG